MGRKDYKLPDTFPKLSFKMCQVFIGSSVLWWVKSEQLIVQHWGQADVSVLPADILDKLFKFLSLLSLVFMFILFLIVCTSVYLCVDMCIRMKVSADA